MKNRFELPDVHFFQKSAEQIEKEMLEHIEKRTGIVLDNADPRRKFIQGLTDYIVQERINADYSFKQNLLSYAGGEFLDHKGIDLDTERLESKASSTIMQIKLEDERVEALLIPRGTRFMVGNITFATIEPFVAAVGLNEVEIYAECTESGAKGNNFLPGEITKLVDVLPWVRSVSNVTKTTGGADTEADDAYASRIRIAPEKFSTAGSTGAYEYWAYTAHQSIVDVLVETPEPGKVDIRVLCANGALPDESIVNAVEEICTDYKVRPLTDSVEVKSPDVVSYDLHVTYFISSKNSTVAVAIKNQIEKAYNDYLVWQKSKIGRDKDFTELIRLMKNAGASRVSVVEDLYMELISTQVAIENEAILEFGGFANE